MGRTEESSLTCQLWKNRVTINEPRRVKSDVRLPAAPTLVLQPHPDTQPVHQSEVSRWEC